MATASRPDAPLLARLDHALFMVESVLAFLAAAVIFAMMFLISAEVLSRRLLDAPIPGQVDITQLAMVSFGVLCVSYCWRKAGHIRMDLLVGLLPGRGRWIAELFAVLVALVVITAILPGTWNHFVRAYEFGDTTFGVGLPTWHSKLAVPVGLGVLWLRLVLELWIYGRLIADPEAEPVGVPKPPDPGEDMDA